MISYYSFDLYFHVCFLAPFSYICWSLVHLLQKNVYLCHLPIFKSGCWLFGLLVFSSGRIVILGLMLKSLIHFELTIVHGVRYSSNFIILHVPVQFSNTIYWGDYPFFQCVFLVALLKISWQYMFRFISMLSILFHYSMSLFFMPDHTVPDQIEKNTFTKLFFAYYLLKALSIYSSKYTMSGTEDAIRLLLGWACSSYSHPSESSQFMQETDLKWRYYKHHHCYDR